MSDQRNIKKQPSLRTATSTITAMTAMTSVTLEAFLTDALREASELKGGRESKNTRARNHQAALPRPQSRPPKMVVRWGVGASGSHLPHLEESSGV